MKRFWLGAPEHSGGQKQMLSIARAIIEPQRLLLSMNRPDLRQRSLPTWLAYFVISRQRVSPF